MSLVNMETGQQALTRQQMKQLNQISRQELENSLLKEVLADYTEKWKDQKEEQIQFIQQQTQEMERLQAMIANQQSLHEQLSSDLHREGDKLIQEFRQRYSTAVTQELESFNRTAE